MNNSTPEKTRIYAIGDIHGCLDLLRTLLDQIVADDLMRSQIETKVLIFLGDYVDRGADSKGVIDLLLDELPEAFEAVFLKGNHETMLLEALYDERAADFWLRNGGRETLASYDIGKTGGEPGLPIPDLIKLLSAKLLPRHLDFLGSLQTSYQIGDYFFAHAGVHPERSLREQRERDLLWIRDPFLFSEKDFGKIVVHGHTPGRDVDEANNRIGIDTAAVYGGKLTALMLEGVKREFLFAQAPKKQKAHNKQ